MHTNHARSRSRPIGALRRVTEICVPRKLELTRERGQARCAQASLTQEGSPWASLNSTQGCPNSSIVTMAPSFSCELNATGYQKSCSCSGRSKSDCSCLFLPDDLLRYPQKQLLPNCQTPFVQSTLRGSRGNAHRTGV